MKDTLGTLTPGSDTRANGINGSGQVVGARGRHPSGDPRLPLRDGQMKDLGTLSGGDVSRASGINGSGQVVGSAARSAASTPSSTRTGRWLI